MLFLIIYRLVIIQSKLQISMAAASQHLLQLLLLPLQYFHLVLQVMKFVIEGMAAFLLPQLAVQVQSTILYCQAQQMPQVILQICQQVSIPLMQ